MLKMLRVLVVLKVLERLKRLVVLVKGGDDIGEKRLVERLVKDMVVRCWLRWWWWWSCLR